eukprot:6205718-Pleurochrysis_carterae.AAC.4
MKVKQMCCCRIAHNAVESNFSCFHTTPGVRFSAACKWPRVCAAPSAAVQFSARNELRSGSVSPLYTSIRSLVVDATCDQKRE